MATLQFAYGTMVGNAHCGVILTQGQGSRASMTLCAGLPCASQHDGQGKSIGLCAKPAREVGAAQRLEPDVGTA